MRFRCSRAVGGRGIDMVETDYGRGKGRVGVPLGGGIGAVGAILEQQDAWQLHESQKGRHLQSCIATKHRRTYHNCSIDIGIYPCANAA